MERPYLSGQTRTSRAQPPSCCAANGSLPAPAPRRARSCPPRTILWPRGRSPRNESTTATTSRGRAPRPQRPGVPARFHVCRAAPARFIPYGAESIRRLIWRHRRPGVGAPWASASASVARPRMSAISCSRGSPAGPAARRWRPTENSTGSATSSGTRPRHPPSSRPVPLARSPGRRPTPVADGPQRKSRTAPRVFRQSARSVPASAGIARDPRASRVGAREAAEATDPRIHRMIRRLSWREASRIAPRRSGVRVPLAPLHSRNLPLARGFRPGPPECRPARPPARHR
jgi:hypothetical protein